MQPVIETKRLILREILPNDEQGLFELDSDPEVHRHLGNKPVDTIEQTRGVIRFIRQQYVDNGIGRWAIIEKSSKDLVGWVGLKFMRERVNDHINYYDLGYRLIRKYWGKGYATEAARVSLKYGFDQLNLVWIYAMADAENAASINVLEKIGLNFVGVFDYKGKKHNWYEISRNEWKNES